MGTHGEKSRQFKFEIMKLHHEDGISVKILAEKFNLKPSTIYTWIETYRMYGKDAFVGTGRQRPEDAELRKLRKENEYLKMQNELLKKLAAYRAKQESEKE